MKSRPRSVLAGTCLLLTLVGCGGPGTAPASSNDADGQVTAYPAPALEPTVDPAASPYPSPDVEQVQPENYPAPSPAP